MESQQGDTKEQESQTSMAEAFFEAIADPILVIDEHDKIERSNAAAEDFFGYSTEEMTGKSISKLILRSKSGEAGGGLRACMIDDARPDGGQGVRTQAQHRDGSTLFIRLVLVELQLDERRLWVATIHDLTDRNRQEMELMRYIQDLESARAQSETHAEKVAELVEQLAAEKDDMKSQKDQLLQNEDELHRYIRDLEMTRAQFEKQAADMVWLAEELNCEKEQVEESRRVIEHQANHDPLTDLGNRALLAKVLPKMIEQAKVAGTKVGLIYIDLDHFKMVNDRLGHEAGDNLLRTVATALRANIRAEDEAIRQGGDEFAVAVRLTAERTEADLRELADRIRIALTIPVECPDSIIETSASIGIALFPEDGLDIDTILTAADTAMYRAKRAGGSRVV